LFNEFVLYLKKKLLCVSNGFFYDVVVFICFSGSLHFLHTASVVLFMQQQEGQMDTLAVVVLIPAVNVAIPNIAINTPRKYTLSAKAPFI